MLGILHKVGASEMDYDLTEWDIEGLDARVWAKRIAAMMVYPPRIT